ncbi:hypothetical protein [Paracoccus methylarcula]|uniref:Uncharacterized protein n=1 Tax=Paracoccus methylarcula TaxID=72022 RepID=A0A3R7PR58_9RHOB|nr:hypothetical protein [Paracoccus methylarcula]RNF35739.1 hypothetical protein A7A09_004970 [Paracoccus methylarcula]
MEDNLTLTDSVTDQDNPAYELNGVFAVTSAKVGDVTVVIGGSHDGEGGLSAFVLDSETGELSQTAPNANVHVDQLRPEALSVVTTSQGTFLYAAGENDGLWVYEIDENGGLTQLPSSGPGQANYGSDPGDNNLRNIEAMTPLTGEDGHQYLLNTSINDRDLTLWQIAEDGTLTQAEKVDDDGTLQIDDVRGADVVNVAGRDFAIVGGGEDGVSVFHVDADGKLQNSYNIHDNQSDGRDGEGNIISGNGVAATELNDIDWITTTTTPSGAGYVYVGGQDNGITVFGIDADGKLSVVQNLGNGTYTDAQGNEVNISLGNLRGADVAGFGETRHWLWDHTGIRRSIRSRLIRRAEN